jgi:hypothetical protein
MPDNVLQRKDASTNCHIQITEREFLKNHTKRAYEFMEFGDYYPVQFKFSRHWQIKTDDLSIKTTNAEKRIKRKDRRQVYRNKFISHENKNYAARIIHLTGVIGAVYLCAG